MPAFRPNAPRHLSLRRLLAVATLSVAALAWPAQAAAVLITLDGDGDQALSFPFGVAAGGLSRGSLHLLDFTTSNIPFDYGVSQIQAVTDIRIDQPDLQVGSESVSVAFDYTLIVAGVSQVIAYTDVGIQYLESPTHQTTVAPVISTTLFYDLGATGTMRVDIVDPSVECTALAGCTASLVGTYTLLPEPGTLLLLAIGVLGVAVVARSRRNR